MTRFSGQAVVITGGARGMGAAHARGFLDEDAAVVITDVLEAEGRALADRLGKRALFIRHDVTSEQDWERVITAAEDTFGPVSVLVNNAGIIGRAAPIEDSDPADWTKVVQINLTGTYLGIRAVTDSMRTAGGGAIVNISSTAGLEAGPLLHSAYVASKWAVRGLTKIAANELGRYGIRVNSVHPGGIETPLIGEFAANAGSDANRPTTSIQAQAIPRMGTPEEVTRMVLFVASDASYTTGSEFLIDGGITIAPALTPTTNR
ncbi:glucose 1-dehydrogenase [Nocardia sp. CDC159]|uniref:Glucose 1-dehydrogenase n=2 Tax=Nocardiaceae TaxID=85025 RepID=A0A9X2E5G6_9NOCA|nr:glucose 1-dehydrogenase [Nocardia pulmonis]MCM6785507.1 glucose 1-dehydrogenase [Nocardia sp. CDC159]